MKLLHTITCSRYVPSYQASEEFTRHLIREYPLTYSGCERILRAEDRERFGTITHQLIVTRIEMATYL